MNEGKNYGEAAGETTAANKLRRFQKEDVEILRLIEERRSTTKEEKQRLKEVSKCMENVSETKRMKRQQDIQKTTRGLQRRKEHPRIQICKEESVHHEDKE